MTPDERLASMGIQLPEVAPPVANYVPARRVGDMVFVSGQLPVSSGTLQHPGVVGEDVTLEEARAAAQTCAVNLLAAAGSVAGGLNSLQVVRVEGFVASARDFTDQAKVINGASDFLVEVFAEAGRHARFAVGVPVLPLGSCVEISAVFAVTR